MAKSKKGRKKRYGQLVEHAKLLLSNVLSQQEAAQVVVAASISMRGNAKLHSVVDLDISG